MAELPFCSAARELDTVMPGGVISPIELFLVCALRVGRRWSVCRPRATGGCAALVRVSLAYRAGLSSSVDWKTTDIDDDSEIDSFIILFSFHHHVFFYLIVSSSSLLRISSSSHLSSHSASFLIPRPAAGQGSGLVLQRSRRSFVWFVLSQKRVVLGEGTSPLLENDLAKGPLRELIGRGILSINLSLSFLISPLPPGTQTVAAR